LQEPEQFALVSALWFSVATITTLFSFCWDVVSDWGLGDVSAGCEHWGLR
jgi:hypothetical protein